MINIRANTAKLLKEEFNIEESVTARLFEKGILQEQLVKKVLVRDEYRKNARPKERNRLKGRLAEKYFISVALVEKIVAKKN